MVLYNTFLLLSNIKLYFTIFHIVKCAIKRKSIFFYHLVYFYVSFNFIKISIGNIFNTLITHFCIYGKVMERERKPRNICILGCFKVITSKLKTEKIVTKVLYFLVLNKSGFSNKSGEEGKLEMEQYTEVGLSHTCRDTLSSTAFDLELSMYSEINIARYMEKCTYFKFGGVWGCPDFQSF